MHNSCSWYVSFALNPSTPRRHMAAAAIVSGPELCLVTLAFDLPDAPAIVVANTRFWKVDRAASPELNRTVREIEACVAPYGLNALALSVAHPHSSDEGNAGDHLRFEALVEPDWRCAVRAVDPNHVAWWVRQTMPTLPGAKFLGLGSRKSKMQVQAIQTAAYCAFIHPSRNGARLQELRG